MVLNDYKKEYESPKMDIDKFLVREVFTAKTSDSQDTGGDIVTEPEF